MLVVKWEEGVVGVELMKVEVIRDEGEDCLHMMIGRREVGVPPLDLMMIGGREVEVPLLDLMMIGGREVEVPLLDLTRMLVTMIQEFEQARLYFGGEKVLLID
jgi:hypothetical protein